MLKLASVASMPGKMRLQLGSGYLRVIDNGQTSCSAKRLLAWDHLKYNNNDKKINKTSIEQHPPIPDVLSGEYAKSFKAAHLTPD